MAERKVYPNLSIMDPEKCNASGETESICNGTTVQSELKLATDGDIILIPQPSDNPNDPLNWSKFRKHLILLIICASAFLPDYGSATGAVTLIPQAK